MDTTLDTEQQKSDLVISAILVSFLAAQWSRIACQCRRCGFDPWVRKIPWRKKWQLDPVFLPGKSHGQMSLAGNSPMGRTESDTTQRQSRQARSIGNLCSSSSFVISNPGVSTPAPCMSLCDWAYPVSHHHENMPELMCSEVRTTGNTLSSHLSRLQSPGCLMCECSHAR